MENINLNNLINLANYVGNEYYEITEGKQLYNLHDVTNDSYYKGSLLNYYRETAILINDSGRVYYLIPNEFGHYVLNVNN